MSFNSQHRPVSQRRYVFQYAVLTIAIFLPLLIAFARLRNTYPFAVWNVMMAGGELQRGRTYFILRGETVTGDTVDIPAAEITNSLRDRTWGLVTAVVNNDSFSLASIHPENARLLSQVGGLNNLPAGTRMPDLLRTWGGDYNRKFPEGSPRHLRAIRIDMYRWDGGSYDHFDRFIESWRQEL